MIGCCERPGQYGSCPIVYFIQNNSVIAYYHKFAAINDKNVLWILNLHGTKYMYAILPSESIGFEIWCIVYIDVIVYFFTPVACL